jgi:hypothetical protein
MENQQALNRAMLDVIRSMSKSINLLAESSATHLTLLRILGGEDVTEEQVANGARVQKQTAAAASAIDELERMFGLPDDAAGQA